MSNSLHMVQMFLPPRLLANSHDHARKAGSDDGYLLHSLFAAAFGELAPKPFYYQSRQRQLEILAYSTTGTDALLAQARLFGKPDLVLALEAGCTSKPMPILAIGTRLGFRVNVVPTVRTQSPGFRKGAEIDAWLAAKARIPAATASGESTISRETVYAEWMQSALMRHGGIQLESLRLSALRSTRLSRRNQERDFHRIEQREAVFKGVLTITESDRFLALLKRGIGRHRAFGFGMILLSPPPRG